MAWFSRLKEWYGQRDSFDKFIFALSGLLLGIVFVSIIFYFLIFSGGLSPEQSAWGLFGDYTGGFGGMLISLVAVLLIFITYRLQQKELKATNEALEAQNTQLEIQQFQNMVFKLLERKDQIIDNLKYKKRSGIEALGVIMHPFRQKMKNNDLSREEALKEFWRNNRGKLTAFFNVFISTVNYLDSFKPSNPRQRKIKEQLIDLYTSNLSTNEKNILNLIIEYHLMQVPEDEKINTCRKIIEDWKIISLEKVYSYN